ncbi:hypothetical protein Adt_27363 [Abeliophyllum distichum]|uniref:Uncharacterized protein n=1 Tax=Abeliophyllum distichum TaxID=126358 RepID=A0ABD1RTJ7_9LAMI
MDIDDRRFDDPDLDDEAKKYRSKESTVLVRLLLSLVMILRKGEMVIGGSLVRGFIFGKPSQTMRRKEIAIDEEKSVVPKRSLEDEGDAIDSRRVKRGRMASLQEIPELIPTSSSAVQGPFSDLSDWTECINIESR